MDVRVFADGGPRNPCNRRRAGRDDRRNRDSDIAAR